MKIISASPCPLSNLRNCSWRKIVDIEGRVQDYLLYLLELVVADYLAFATVYFFLCDVELVS